MLRKLNSSRSGFTLVEIMIVVAIIALLAAIAVPNFLRARKRSQATAILEEMRLIDAAKDQYAIENNLVKRKNVKVGTADAGGRVQVLDGLAAGDRIVRVNLGSLREGLTARLAGPQPVETAEKK